MTASELVSCLGSGRMNTRFLETFVWVARLRSFSAAAERLNSTQAAISNRIRALEAELGVKLLDRNSRSVTLTREGRVAFAKAQRIVNLASAFVLDVSHPDAIQGSVSIGIIDTIIHTWFPDFAKLMREAFPMLKLSLTVDATPKLYQQLQHGELDLAFGVGSAASDGFYAVELGTFDCVWVGSPASRFSSPPTSIADIEDCPIVSYSVGSVPDQSLRALLGRHAIPLENRVFNTNSLPTIIHLVREGVGIAYLPECIIRPLISSKELILLPIGEKLAPMTYHAIYAGHHEDPLPERVAAIARVASSNYLNG
uniref:Transcriptional regulator, LysR family n=2 Tax=Phyllobacteriaceae TaxID=69277 RepID=Q11LB7_CHESB